MFPNIWGQISETVDRMADNAALAAVQGAGGRMYIEPERVEEAAAFFLHEAEMLRSRGREINYLAQVDPPGSDDVSTQLADKYGQVASGGGQSYKDAYNALGDYLADVGNKLRASAQQTRTNDQDAADSLRH
jgi:hypothetical protein